MEVGQWGDCPAFKGEATLLQDILLQGLSSVEENEDFNFSTSSLRTNRTGLIRRMFSVLVNISMRQAISSNM